MSIELLSIQSLLCCLAFFCAGVVDSITGGGGLITIPVMLAVGIPVHYITGTNQCSAPASRRPSICGPGIST